MSVEDVSGVVVEVDGEGHGHSQGQGRQSLLVPGVQGGAHGDPQVGNRGHLGMASSAVTTVPGTPPQRARSRGRVPTPAAPGSGRLGARPTWGHGESVPAQMLALLLPAVAGLIPRKSNPQESESMTVKN